MAKSPNLQNSVNTDANVPKSSSSFSSLAAEVLSLEWVSKLWPMDQRAFAYFFVFLNWECESKFKKIMKNKQKRGTN